LVALLLVSSAIVAIKITDTSADKTNIETAVSGALMRFFSGGMTGAAAFSDSIEWANTDPYLADIVLDDENLDEPHQLITSGTIYVNLGETYVCNGQTLYETIVVYTGGRLEMTDCKILNVSTGVVFYSGSSGFIRDSTITTTSSYGANIDSYKAVDNIEITNNTLNGGAYYGIWIDERSENWNIKDNEIHGHSRGIMATNNYYDDVSHTIDNNYIHDNTYGVKLYGIARGSSQIQITNNEFENNNAYAIYAYISSIHVAGNTFTTNGHACLDWWTHCSAIADVGSTSVDGWYNVKRSVIEKNIFNQHTTAIEGYFADPLVENNHFTRVAAPDGRNGWSNMIWIRGGTGFKPPTYQAKWNLDCNLFESETVGEAIIMTGGGYGESGLWADNIKTIGFSTAGIRTFLDNRVSYVTVTDWDIDAATPFNFHFLTRNTYDTNNNGLWDDAPDTDGEGTYDWNGNGIIDGGQTVNALTGCELPGFKKTIPATIDIDPDTLNLKSNGKWITAYTELPLGFDVSEIIIPTIELFADKRENGTSCTLYVDPDAPSNVGDYDSDEIPDLMVKFDRQELIACLDEMDFDGETGIDEIIELVVTGDLTSGIEFEGSDWIRVIKKGN